MRLDVLFQIIEPGDAGQALAGVCKLEFLAELLLVDGDKNIANLILGCVNIDVVVGLELAPVVIASRQASGTHRRCPCEPYSELGRVGRRLVRPCNHSVPDRPVGPPQNSPYGVEKVVRCWPGRRGQSFASLA